MPKISVQSDEKGFYAVDLGPSSNTVANNKNKEVIDLIAIRKKRKRENLIHDAISPILSAIKIIKESYDYQNSESKKKLLNNLQELHTKFKQELETQLKTNISTALVTHGKLTNTSIEKISPQETARIEEQVEDDFNTTSIYKNSCTCAQSTLTMVNAVSDVWKTKEEKLDAIKIYKTECQKKSSFWSKVGKTVLSVAAAAVGFILGAVIGAAIGFLAGAATGPGAIVTTAIGAVKGASIGLSFGTAIGSAVIAGGATTYGLFAERGVNQAITNIADAAKSCVEEKPSTNNPIANALV
jgi:hypothetical protein